MPTDLDLKRLGPFHARPRRRRTPVGASPGTLIADPAAERPTIRLIGYGPSEVEERDGLDSAAVAAALGRHAVVWVDVTGLADLELVRAIGRTFGFHPLALEDVINVHQRPKVEEYEDHVYIATRMLTASPEAGSEQLSLFAGASFVVTFQERPGDVFEPVRERLRHGRGQIRSLGPDYLAYALLDAVIDGYFPVLERYGERLEELEDRVVAEPHNALASEIHEMKRDLLALRRCVWPQREMINTLIRDENPCIKEQTRIYLRDCYDHCIQLMDMLETYREIASGLIDVYLSSMSTRLSEVMKVLTIIATIFIPLGFIASLYGMNFDPAVSPWNMPELEWYWGYPAALALMLAVALGLLGFFWRRGWIGRKARSRRARSPRAGRPP
jgi:magnesium transporter